MALAIAVLQKALPQTPSVQLLWGISEMLEQCPDRDIVVVERPILGTTLLVHPTTKSNQDRRSIGRIRRWSIDNTCGVQMAQKQRGAGELVHGIAVAKRTAPLAEMATEALNQTVVPLRDGYTVVARPVSEMLR
jgi:hypothetical protein